MLPEVFVKALNLARNVGHPVRDLTTVDMDFIRHYRPGVNVVARPTAAGGRGIQLTGHHEIMFPLLWAAVEEALAGVMALITLTTDFGTTDPVRRHHEGRDRDARARSARVVDVTHGIPPQDVLAGALVLRHAVPCFPPGTIHVAVVDPGVGERAARRSASRPTAALFVGPDNGAPLAGGARRRACGASSS